MVKRSVLVVDADAEIRQLVRESIEGNLRNVRVYESPNGLDALKKFEIQTFDLVVLEMALPQKDGLDVLRFIRDLPRTRKPRHVLVLTGSIDEAELRKRSAEPFLFLGKPCRSSEVIEKVRPLLADEDGPAIEGPASNGETDTPDATIINAFIESTLTVLSTMASTEAKKEQTFLREADRISGDVSAIVAINGARQSGSMAISFDEKCFLGVMTRMLGEPVTSITPDVSDGAGELCNQIFGMTKRKLNTMGMDIPPAIPSVVTGTAHSIKHLTSGPVIAVRFTTSDGGFTIEATLVRNR